MYLNISKGLNKSYINFNQMNFKLKKISLKISNLKIYECCLYKPVEMTLKYMPYFVDEETKAE